MSWNRRQAPLPPVLQSRCDRFFANARREGLPVAVIVDFHLPEYDRHAAGMGTYQYTRLLCELGFAVVFIPDDRQPDEPYGSALRRLGVEVCDSPFDFGAWISRYGGAVELGWLSRTYVAVPYVDPIRAASSAKIIFCGHDLHFVRLGRQAGVEGRPELYATADRARTMERWLVRRADAVVTFSSTERQLIFETFGAADKVHVVPAYIYDVDSQAHDVPVAGRRDLVFVGNFRHDPNADAVRWFRKEIWPLVAPTLPEARFVVLGPDAGKLGLAPDERLDVVGYVPDLDPHFARARLSVAPLRFGAGIKGKVVASLARGVPLVATAIAAEGMGLTDGIDVLLADEPESFARQISRLWHDEQLWADLSAAGRAYVARGFSHERARDVLAGLLASLGVSSELAT
jgi:glycosyltransferase involved in cell wall biosynthesis